MKPQIGQVTEYNGYTGKINSESQDYLLLNNNINHGQEKLNVQDKVEFIPEQVNDVKIARFVKKKIP